jgi:hypothetical protein
MMAEADLALRRMAGLLEGREGHLMAEGAGQLHNGIVVSLVTMATYIILSTYLEQPG